jgi:GNAT superfamily N-acetyltransferase
MNAELHLRKAGPGDYDLFIEFLALLKLPPGEPVRGFEGWQRDLMPKTLFLEERSRPVGYAVIDPQKPTSYLRQLAVRQEEQRRGLATELMLRLAERAWKGGARSWCLNVVCRNDAAIALYRKMGMTPRYATAVFRLRPEQIARLQGPDRSVLVRTLLREEDAATEAAWNLNPGLLAEARMVERRLFFCLTDPAAAHDKRIGMAIFDPAFPGAFPFRVAAPALARPLLERLWSLVPEGKSWLQLVVEDDTALATACRDADAEQILDLLHLKGPLPVDAPA